jgi:hypothetical protein
MIVIKRKKIKNTKGVVENFKKYSRGKVPRVPKVPGDFGKKPSPKNER